MRRLFRRQGQPSDDDPDDVTPFDESAYADADRDANDAYGDDDDYEAYDSTSYQEPDIEPFVPVSGDYYTGAFASDDQSETAAVDLPRRRRRMSRGRLPRPSLPRVKLPGLNVDLDWTYALLAVFLFVAGIFGVLLKKGDITGDLKAWWPLALVITSGLWMLIALARRQVASFLGGTAFAGMGLSLLLDTQDIAAVEETILGTVLVTVGLGIVMRGFLLRQQIS
jgi:hypothetical protein